MDKNILLAATVKGIDEATKDIRAFVNSMVDASSFVEADRFLTGKSLLDGSSLAGEGVLTGYAAIDGAPVYIVAQNSAALGGSFGIGQAKKIINCMENAIKNGCLLISIIDSNGARIGEGVTVMDGYAALLKKATVLKSSVLHIAVVRGKAVGHMAAYLALCDYVFTSQDAVISFNPPTVLAQASTKSVKDLFGQKTHAAESGVADFVFDDGLDLKGKITSLINYISGVVEDSADDANRESAALASDISASCLLDALCDDGRRLEYCSGYAKEIKCCFAKVNGISVGVAVSNRADGEYLSLSGADKLTAFISLLASFNIPFITLVDCKGIITTTDEEQNAAIGIISNLFESVALHAAPKISVAVGNAIGAAYTALISKSMGFDYSIAFPTALVAPLNLDTAVSLVYSEQLSAKGNSPKLRSKLEELYREERASAIAAAESGSFDEVIAPEALRPYIANALLMLLGL